MVLCTAYRELSGSSSVAIETAQLLSIVVSRSRFQTIAQLLEMVRSVGKTLTEAHPQELCIGNVVRRVLFIVRQESATTVRLDSASNNNANASAKDVKSGAASGSTVLVAAAAPSTAAAAAPAPEVKQSNKPNTGSSDAGDSGAAGGGGKEVTVDMSLSLHKLLDEATSDSLDHEFANKPIVQSTSTDCDGWWWWR